MRVLKTCWTATRCPFTPHAMNPYPRRNPVLFKRRSFWQRSWVLIALFALALSQKGMAIRLADVLAGLVTQIGTGRKAEDPASEQARKEAWEIWMLRREIEQLKVQLDAPSSSVEQKGTAHAAEKGFERHLAPIIARDPGDWASFIWVEAPNETAAQEWIEAPAIVGDIAIGMVDFAHHRRCRVRLISDAQLSLSVTLSAQCEAASQIADQSSEGAVKCPPMVGQVRGLGGALWNSSGTLLIGEGYIPGPTRIEICELTHINILRSKRFAPGDLLVTSGLDGIFPKNLRVGVVERVESDESSNTRYEFSAKSAVDLHALSEVWILKKGGCDSTTALKTSDSEQTHA